MQIQTDLTPVILHRILGCHRQKNQSCDGKPRLNNLIAPVERPGLQLCNGDTHFLPVI
jgi:hypothetical protein